jgi:hypothetical protein
VKPEAFFQILLFDVIIVPHHRVAGVALSRVRSSKFVPDCSGILAKRVEELLSRFEKFVRSRDLSWIMRFLPVDDQLTIVGLVGLRQQSDNIVTLATGPKVQQVPESPAAWVHEALTKPSDARI